MLTALRRVALGIAVVAAASMVLLLSDLQHRERAARAALTRKHTWKIYFVQYNDVIDVKDAESGVLDGLRESGLEDGRDFEVEILNAQGDMATVSALIDTAVTGGADMLITFSTPTLQAALRRVSAGRVATVGTGGWVASHRCWRTWTRWRCMASVTWL